MHVNILVTIRETRSNTLLYIPVKLLNVELFSINFVSEKNISLTDPGSGIVSEILAKNADASQLGHLLTIIQFKQLLVLQLYVLALYVRYIIMSFSNISS